MFDTRQMIAAAIVVLVATILVLMIFRSFRSKSLPAIPSGRRTKQLAQMGSILAREILSGEFCPCCGRAMRGEHLDYCWVRPWAETAKQRQAIENP